MALEPLDWQSDQAIFDNLVPIAYASAGTATTVSVTDAGFYQLDGAVAEGAPSEGVYVKVRARFTIRNSLIGSLGPKPADTITDGNGNVWTVLRVTPPKISGVWQLDCIDLIVSNGLAQSGTLARPSNTEQDAAFRQALVTYSTIATGIVCRVQPVDSDAADDMERRTLPQRFTAILGSQVVAQAKDRFTAGGVTYTVLSFRLPQRIDELMTLSLELIG